MTPATRRAVLAHLAAHGVDGRSTDNRLELRGLQDFFAEAVEPVGVWS
jgi:hypothetical protein